MLPQEIEVWYVLPAIRKELVIELVKNQQTSQKEAAGLLGITAAAVSQYISKKRAELNLKIGEEIRQSALRIRKGESPAAVEMMRLSRLPEIKKMVCQMHMQKDPTISKTCDICLK